MKKMILLVGLLYSIIPLIAQHLSVAGTVQTQSGQSLRQASVLLRSVGAASASQTILTDSTGRYRFASLPQGKYLLTASYTSYEPQVSDTLLLSAMLPAATFQFVLQPVADRLQNVTVSTSKAPVQVEGGKMVFNLQNGAVMAGQTAFDVLKKLPGVTIDQNENILFRGTAGVNVMVDGKMTYLSGTQLTNYLKGLSAEDLSKIELMATPGAAFDAAGNAGIIQIITKRKKAPGYAIDVRSAASWSKWWLWNENVSASLRTQRWNVYGSFDYNTPHRYYNKESGNTLPGSGGNLRLQRVQETIFKIKYYTWRAGAEWQLHPKHTLGFRYHGYFDNWKGTHYSTVNTLKKQTGRLSSFIRSTNLLKEPYHYDAPSLSYRYTLDSMGKRLTADADYTSYRNYSDGLLTTQNFTAIGSFTGENRLQVHQPGFIKIKSVKVDADLPFKAFTLAAGLKWAEVENDNQYQFDSLLNGQFVGAESMSNHFKYREKITAAYASAGKSWKRTQVNAGLRLESTDALGYTVKGTDGNTWKYTQLFPSASITQQVGRNQELGLSASRRINRPSYADLNPIRWYSDQYFYYSGNPRLVPELAWVLAATYTLQKKYVMTASYNRSTNYTSRLLVVEESTIKSITANLGTQQRLDITASVPITPLPFWMVQLFTNWSYTRYPISMKAGLQPLSRWANTTTLQQSFTLPGRWEATLNANYYSSELRGIYLTRPTGLIDAGVRKTLLHNRLTAQFNCNDIFNTNRYRASSQTDVIDYFYNDKQYTRQLSLSLTYHLGGSAFKTSNRKTEEQERL